MTVGEGRAEHRGCFPARRSQRLAGAASMRGHDGRSRVSLAHTALPGQGQARGGQFASGVGHCHMATPPVSHRVHALLPSAGVRLSDLPLVPLDILHRPVPYDRFCVAALHRPPVQGERPRRVTAPGA